MSVFAIQMLVLTGLMAIAIRCVSSGPATLEKPAASAPAPVSAPSSQAASLPFDPNDARQLRNAHIVVEKSKRLLTVFEDGRLVKSYPVITGSGKGDKVREGDRCTPEGEFYVCLKNKESKYVLSLGLSYPNAEDAERGLRAGQITRTQHDEIVKAIAARQQPNWYTPLGGEIMIHGCAEGRDSTAGCVAMKTEDIRELFFLIPMDARVTILP